MQSRLKSLMLHCSFLRACVRVCRSPERRRIDAISYLTSIYMAILHAEAHNVVLGRTRFALLALDLPAWCSCHCCLSIYLLLAVCQKGEQCRIRPSPASYSSTLKIGENHQKYGSHPLQLPQITVQERPIVQISLCNYLPFPANRLRQCAPNGVKSTRRQWPCTPLPSSSANRTRCS